MKVRNKLERWVHHIKGSAAYFKGEKKKLEALIEQKGDPTIWFTFSFADRYWQDVLDQFGKPPESFSEDERDKWLDEQCRNNQSLASFGLRKGCFSKLSSVNYCATTRS
jgi:hypothetical protein